MCRLSWNLGASTSWNPQSLSGPVMGLLYHIKCSQELAVLHQAAERRINSHSWGIRISEFWYSTWFSILRLVLPLVAESFSATEYRTLLQAPRKFAFDLCEAALLCITFCSIFLIVLFNAVTSYGGFVVTHWTHFRCTLDCQLSWVRFPWFCCFFCFRWLSDT